MILPTWEINEEDVLKLLNEKSKTSKTEDGGCSKWKWYKIIKTECKKWYIE